LLAHPFSGKSQRYNRADPFLAFNQKRTPEELHKSDTKIEPKPGPFLLGRSERVRMLEWLQCTS